MRNGSELAWECACGNMEYSPEMPEECSKCHEIDCFIQMPEEVMKIREVEGLDDDTEEPSIKPVKKRKKKK